MNPAVNAFAPNITRQTGIAHQVSISPYPYLEARILNLEEGHVSLYEDINLLREMIHGLSSSVQILEKGGWPVHVGPSQLDLKKSHRDATELKMELEKLKLEVTQSLDGSADAQKANGMTTSKSTGSVPPHLRASNVKVAPKANSMATPKTAGSVTSNGTVKKSLPPHLRNKKVEVGNDNSTPEQVADSIANSPLATDGQVDPGSNSVSTPMPTASTPSKTADQKLPTSAGDNQQEWKPYHLMTIAAFQGRIPSGDATVTFHPDFLDNILGGAPWSPGLRFVQGKGPCLLKNRTYYQLDPENDPYLPKTAGEHGAKLTAFFNESPQDAFPHLVDSDFYEDVPMFVLVGKRYVYYGNYSQTRWSDKLDHDTMATKVLQSVKEFWAEELTSSTREKWVTEELKKHFFPKPQYEGRLFAVADNDTTVDTEEDNKLTEKMVKDIHKYAQSLRVWERDANMKTAMIKKQFILDSFNASDMDEPPALRLWWEYLECVGWKKDFYDLLVILQKRDAKSYLP
ncbi:hypothetical protein PtrSN002B_000699 [Pyrenophora tritici-repentis]|uniref:DUF6697 domain-containing protein n=2 Tax=Pyrenophora tritici-repentis TaxID=45151 RepID=A0A2W1HRE9_9PLEO|nr:uncharacterized protein PTRG_03019 [Pyrenophora tritici-repentis Pt-1C-BFP]KAA8622898.1 hypothetical protein PtrV1_04204 [Pyrenophora tritici-repentis]EDU45542.1 predicted protein [Pyrenophora tritici-repentis Pt-1C-BFP]KAF7451888.1 hypothetical protein A1F99_036650 [Pyrenophora tritici-repentis]KAF7574988.1 hypothetical protein PtrM4_066120 [Pyrenophora tritici-repentis]KAG9386246.1 hypothetical protein A1F94_002996 [Pyrenophora tritici-repentis]